MSMQLGLMETLRAIELNFAQLFSTNSQNVIFFPISTDLQVVRG